MEVAGLVLGAFPIAFLALQQYEAIGATIDAFLSIKTRHKKFTNDLRFEEVLLKNHLRQFILPLAVHHDDDEINDLLDNPDGPGWTDAIVAKKLEKRLGEQAYHLYLDCIRTMQQVMKDLNHELAIDPGASQKQGQQPTDNNRRPGVEDTRLPKRFIVRFMKSEKRRQTLLAELQRERSKLKELLSVSNADAQLQVTEAKTKAIDTTVGKFFDQATKIFTMIANAWGCRGREPQQNQHQHQHQHQAKLQLQHRTTAKPDFSILFETTGEGPLIWAKRRARVSEEVGEDVAQTTSVQPAAGLGDTGQIECLCSSLKELERGCCGYLILDDSRYYVYPEGHEDHAWQAHFTLEDVLKGRAVPRKQAYVLSLIVASSFVQLFETPWLLESLTKSSIVFFRDKRQTGRNVFKLDQPHVTRQSINTAPGGANPHQADLIHSLEELGILLLELCFVSVLEEKECRRRWPIGETETERHGYNILAAREWLKDVEEEVGIGYSNAVAWCLKGNQSAKSNPSGGWREEMLRNVVQPLQQCVEHTAAGGLL